MKFEYRGSLKSSKEIVDIIKFDGEIAKCGDLKDRHIDEFNTIFYSVNKFKKDILKIENIEKLNQDRPKKENIISEIRKKSK